jgi:hypothetical protein
MGFRMKFSGNKGNLAPRLTCGPRSRFANDLRTLDVCRLLCVQNRHCREAPLCTNCTLCITPIRFTVPQFVLVLHSVRNTMSPSTSAAFGNERHQRSYVLTTRPLDLGASWPDIARICEQRRKASRKFGSFTRSRGLSTGSMSRSPRCSSPRWQPARDGSPMAARWQPDASTMPARCQPDRAGLQGRAGFGLHRAGIGLAFVATYEIGLASGWLL